jgi:hypothetical protein
VSEVVLQHSPIHLQATQKIRKDIAKALLNEGWTQEGLAFIEKAKRNMSGSIEDFFLYEMQVLNYDKVLRPKERYKRFIDLIHKTLNFK